MSFEMQSSRFTLGKTCPKILSVPVIEIVISAHTAKRDGTGILIYVQIARKTLPVSIAILPVEPRLSRVR